MYYEYRSIYSEHKYQTIVSDGKLFDRHLKK